MKIDPIPDGFHTITPYLIVSGADELIQFVEKAFDAKVVERINRPDGKVGHATIQIGNSMIMLAQESPQWKTMLATLYLYVPDTDATYKRALEAGGISIVEPTDQFYGDRNAGVKDAFGNHWWIGTRIEKISSEELHKRAEAAMKKGCSQG